MTYLKRGDKVSAKGKEGIFLYHTFGTDKKPLVTIVEHNDDPNYPNEKIAYHPTSVKPI